MPILADKGEFKRGGEMEIGPVTESRALSVFKVPPVDSGLSEVFDIENFARIKDETYSPSGGESAGGSEDEFEDLEDQEEAESAGKALENGDAPKISFFA
jgi:hypothetical protein